MSQKTKVPISLALIQQLRMKVENEKEFFVFASKPEHKHNKSENSLLVEFAVEAFLSAKAIEFARNNSCGLQVAAEVCINILYSNPTVNHTICLHNRPVSIYFQAGLTPSQLTNIKATLKSSFNVAKQSQHGELLQQSLKVISDFVSAHVEDDVIMNNFFGAIAKPIGEKVVCCNCLLLEIISKNSQTYFTILLCVHSYKHTPHKNKHKHQQFEFAGTQFENVHKSLIALCHVTDSDNREGSRKEETRENTLYC
jgi:hypothetical protein